MAHPPLKRAKLLHSLKDPSRSILDNPLSISVADHTQIRSVLGIMSLKNFKIVSNSQLWEKFSCQIYLKILLTLFVLFRKLQGVEPRWKLDWILSLFLNPYVTGLLKVACAINQPLNKHFFTKGLFLQDDTNWYISGLVIVKLPINPWGFPGDNFEINF